MVRVVYSYYSYPKMVKAFPGYDEAKAFWQMIRRQKGVRYAELIV